MNRSAARSGSSAYAAGSLGASNRIRTLVKSIHTWRDRAYGHGNNQQRSRTRHNAAVRSVADRNALDAVNATCCSSWCHAAALTAPDNCSPAIHPSGPHWHGHPFCTIRSTDNCSWWTKKTILPADCSPSTSLFYGCVNQRLMGSGNAQSTALTQSIKGSELLPAAFEVYSSSYFIKITRQTCMKKTEPHVTCHKQASVNTRTFKNVKFALWLHETSIAISQWIVNVLLRWCGQRVRDFATNQQQMWSELVNSKKAVSKTIWARFKNASVNKRVSIQYNTIQYNVGI